MDAANLARPSGVNTPFFDAGLATLAGEVVAFFAAHRALAEAEILALTSGVIPLFFPFFRVGLAGVFTAADKPLFLAQRACCAIRILAMVAGLV